MKAGAALADSMNEQQSKLPQKHQEIVQQSQIQNFWYREELANRQLSRQVTRPISKGQGKALENQLATLVFERENNCKRLLSDLEKRAWSG